MYSISRFQQIIKPISQQHFQKHVNKNQADKYSKGFRCHDLLIGMVYAQLTGCTSLRTLQQRFNSQHTHYYHLATRTLHRSTLAEALQKRNSQPFADMAAELMQQCSRRIRQEGKELIRLLDSTPIPLKGKGFDQWTNSNGRIRGIKMHVLSDASTGCPIHTTFTCANVNDITEGKTMPIEKGTTYVFDKGYCDYNWWHDIHKAEAFFVSRLKTNAALKVKNSRPTDGQSDILHDETVVLTHKKNRGGGRINLCADIPLRRITVRREGKSDLVLISNRHEGDAEEIAELYRQRWQIELLFKWLKQHLKLKTFLGRSQNAVKIQLLCALIGYLLLKLYQQQYRPETSSLWLLLAELSVCLFERMQTVYEGHRRRCEDRERWRQKQGVLF